VRSGPTPATQRGHARHEAAAAWPKRKNHTVFEPGNRRSGAAAQVTGVKGRVGAAHRSRFGESDGGGERPEWRRGGSLPTAQRQKGLAPGRREGIMGTTRQVLGRIRAASGRNGAPCLGDARTRVLCDGRPAVVPPLLPGPSAKSGMAKSGTEPKAEVGDVHKVQNAGE